MKTVTTRYFIKDSKRNMITIIKCLRNEGIQNINKCNKVTERLKLRTQEYFLITRSRVPIPTARQHEEHLRTPTHLSPPPTLNTSLVSTHSEMNVGRDINFLWQHMMSRSLRRPLSHWMSLIDYVSLDTFPVLCFNIETRSRTHWLGVSVSTKYTFYSYYQEGTRQNTPT